MACRVSTRGITFQDAFGKVVGCLVSSCISMLHGTFQTLSAAEASFKGAQVKGELKAKEMNADHVISSKCHLGEVVANTLECDVLKGKQIFSPITRIKCLATGIWEKDKPVLIELQRHGQNVCFIKMPPFKGEAVKAGKIRFVDEKGQQVMLPIAPVFSVGIPITVLDDAEENYGALNIKTNGAFDINNACGNFTGKQESGLANSVCVSFLCNEGESH
jgi:hypothetical protein